MKKMLFVFSLLLAPFSVLLAQQLSIEEAVMGNYGDLNPEKLDQLQWVEGEDDLTFVDDNKLMIVNKRGKKKVLFTLTSLNKQIDDSLSSFPEVNWIDKNNFYFNRGKSYYKSNLKKDKTNLVLQYGEDGENADYHQKSNRVAFTIDNNLFFQNGETQVQVTDEEDGIVSGQAIHRYEFGISKGTFWSPDGGRLAFYQKDERGVSDYPIPDYDKVPAENETIKYPMAGQQSEIPKVGVYDLEKERLIYLDVEDGKLDDSFYITNLTWNPDGKTIYLAIVNRDQNQMYLGAWNAGTGDFLGKVVEENDEEYVEPEHGPIFSKRSQYRMLWFSERNGFNHLYQYDTKGDLHSQVTDGEFDVTEFLGFSEDGNHIFVQATGENPTDRHLYRAALDGSGMKKLTSESGTHNGKLSDSGKYFIDEFSSLDVPRKIFLKDEEGDEIANLFEAENPLKDKTYGQTEIFSHPAEDGTPLWCRMIKPSNFDEVKQYPVLVYVYNGPHVQLVRNTWLGAAPLWMHSLVEDGYIIFTVDGRGSSNRGIDFEQAVFRNLGNLEMKDQVHLANWLKKQPFTDEGKFVVHGWSYGGFMTTSLMLRHPDVFEAGVAGGPVIDWKFYEVMYTERYMDTPESNPGGFETAALPQYVENLEGDLLMIHGTSDDVVVLQHNMAFLKACVEKGMHVDFMAYPGHKHNVHGKDRVHLISKIVDFLKDSLEEK